MPVPGSAPLVPAPADLCRERARLARCWPAAVRDVLLIAARVDRFNRQAVAVGVSPIVDPPVAAVGPMWRGLFDAE